MLKVGEYEIIKMKKAVEGYLYKVKNQQHTFAVIGRRMKEKVCYDETIQKGEVEITIVKKFPKEKEEEILYHTTQKVENAG
jgi:hypothetical protein